MATTFIPFRWRSEAAKWAATGVVTRAAGDAPPARPGRPATHRWSRTLLLEWRCAVPTGTPAPTGRSTGRRTPTAAVHPTHSNRSFAPLINGTSRSFFPRPRLPLPRNRTFPNGTQLPPQITHPHQAQLRTPEGRSGCPAGTRCSSAPAARAGARHCCLLYSPGSRENAAEAVLPGPQHGKMPLNSRTPRAVPGCSPALHAVAEGRSVAPRPARLAGIRPFLAETAVH